MKNSFKTQINVFPKLDWVFKFRMNQEKYIFVNDSVSLDAVNFIKNFVAVAVGRMYEIPNLALLPTVPLRLVGLPPNKPASE